MSSGDMHVEGGDLRALAAELTAAGPLARLKATRVVRKAAYDVVAGGQQRVPVDTGATRNSIHATFWRHGDEFGADIGPTTSYSPYLEFGTSRMPPRPYMGPALDKVSGPFGQAIEALGGDVLP